MPNRDTARISSAVLLHIGNRLTEVSCVWRLPSGQPAGRGHYPVVPFGSADQTHALAVIHDPPALRPTG